MKKQDPLILPECLYDKHNDKARKKLQSYYRKIKKADVSVEPVQEGYIHKIRISFETYNKRNKGMLEVNYVEL